MALGFCAYIYIFKPVSGSYFLLVQLLAEKNSFIPKFVQEKAADMVKSNRTYYGMVHTVSEMFLVSHPYCLCRVESAGGVPDPGGRAHHMIQALG